MLRLGKKYGIDHLWDSAKERLAVELPTTLECWDKAYDDKDRKAKTHVYHAFDFVNVLFDVGIKSLLPAAYLACIESHSLVRLKISRVFGC